MPAVLGAKSRYYCTSPPPPPPLAATLRTTTTAAHTLQVEETHIIMLSAIMLHRKVVDARASYVSHLLCTRTHSLTTVLVGFEMHRKKY